MSRRSVGIIWFVVGITIWLVLDSPAGIPFFIIGIMWMLGDDDEEED